MSWSKKGGLQNMRKTKEWIKAAGIRAVKTMAQAAIAMIGTSVVMSDVDWKMVVSATILSGILSILTSLAGLPEVDGKDEIRLPEGKE